MTESNKRLIVWLLVAHASTSPAIAAAAIITSAYSAVVCPRWPGSSRPYNTSQMRKRVSDTNVSSHSVNGFAADSAAHPAEHDGNDSEQREGRQDAGHEGEAQTNRHRPGARFGASADIGTNFGCEPGKCR